MTTRVMVTNASLSLAAVMEAIKVIVEAEGLGKKPGTAPPVFFELEFAPAADEAAAANEIASELLRDGFGIKLSVHWPFAGSRRWAVKTETTRVVNDGA